MTNGFKLLAVIPLKGCNKKFSKNLKAGTPYNFYKDYEVQLNDEKTDVTQVINKSKQNFNQLYNLQNGIQVNISAVVGVNGSGKSTLIELLYYFVYAGCVQLKHNGDNVLQRYSDFLASESRKLNRDINDLRGTEDLFKTIYFQNKYALVISHYDKSKYHKEILSLLESRRNEHLSQKKAAKKLDLLIERELNVAIVFETEKGLFSARYYKSDLEIKSLSPIVSHKQIQLDDFFYSICLNFSHHSLNSNTLGQWINTLFHKNDAYTTPVVISPMRNNGILDINKELHLSNERLMSNLAYDIAYQKVYKLLGKYNISKFLFNAKRPLTSYAISYGDENEFNKLSSASLLKKHLRIKSFIKNAPFLDYAISYLENKIEKIRGQYEQFFLDRSGNFDEDKFNEFIQNDQSHITKKVRQTLNFLKATHASDSTLWGTGKHPYHKLSISKFIAWMGLCEGNYKNCTPAQLMEFALPGFFNIDYELVSENGDTIKLSELSSGEQQMILNINTITYHLYNLQSVYKSKKSNTDRIRYNNVAIFLDEIELYYHPEMQRKLVANILDVLELVKVKEEKGIESINLCFLTHSPFILSDIPNSNILQLNVNKNGESEVVDSNNETFGANINDLLADNFFLYETLIGAFAENNINNLIDKINKKQHFNERDNVLLNKIGDTFLKSSIEYLISD